MRTLIVVCLLTACATPSQRPAGEAGARPPGILLGTFEDDYGSRYEGTDSTWRHGASTYRVEEWNPTAHHLLLTDADDAGASVWLRIDWVELPDNSGNAPWSWAWCMAAWNAKSRAAALAAAESRRDAPRSGCGDGFPFTRMRSAPPP